MSKSQQKNKSFQPGDSNGNYAAPEYEIEIKREIDESQLIRAVSQDDEFAGNRNVFMDVLHRVLGGNLGSDEVTQLLSTSRPDMFWIADAHMSRDGGSITVRDKIIELPKFDARDSRLAPGLYAIIGKARSGKSTLAASLVTAGIQHVEIGEPTPTSLDRYSLSHVLFAALVDGADVVIDSIKYLITEGRNPGQFGVTAKFTEFLTAVSVLAARRGIRIFVVINPYMIPNADMGVFIDRIESSTSGVIVPASPDVWLIRSRDRRDAVHRFKAGDVDLQEAVAGSSVRSAFYLSSVELSDGATPVEANSGTLPVQTYDLRDVDTDDQYVAVADAAFKPDSGPISEQAWTFKNVKLNVLQESQQH